MTVASSLRTVGFAAALWIAALSHPCPAQSRQAAPEPLAAVGITERLGAPIPRELLFRDERDRPVQLADLFAERPVILSLTYSDCPMLCHLQLDGLVRSLQDVSLSPARDFEIVNISIDPREPASRALLTKRKHVEAYGRPETAAGWHFLTGSEANIRRLADAVGFRYTFLPERNEYAHAAVIMIATADARLSHYLYGVDYSPATLRLALVEASDGKIGSAVDQILLFCFHYDATSGRYAPVAFRVMQLGGSLTLAALLIGLVPYWLKRSGKAADARDRHLTRHSDKPIVPMES